MYYSGIKGRRFEPGFVQSEPGFCRYLLIGVSYDSDFFERKEHSEHIEHLMLIRRIEKFLTVLPIKPENVKLIFNSQYYINN